jgi:hypothetical protein
VASRAIPCLWRQLAYPEWDPPEIDRDGEPWYQKALFRLKKAKRVENMWNGGFGS